MSTSIFLRPEQVSERLGVTITTLSNWRCKGANLPFYKPSGRTVYYKADDVEAYIESTVRDVSEGSV